MKATYDVAIRYDLNAVCLTPLRTGATENDTEAVLRTADGIPFIQGSSLAGAMQDWLRSHDNNTADVLFGNKKQSGKLIVSDAMFLPDSTQYSRPHLKINRTTGAADEGAKFDIAHIAANSKITFSVCYLGSSDSGSDITATEEMLSALNCGEILLGAQKNNGFGRVKLSGTKSIYHMTDEKEREDWFKGIANGEGLTFTTPAKSKAVRFTVEGTADSILVKSSVPKQEGKSTFAVNITENETPVLPGSSVKGAIRSRCEAIAELCGTSQSRLDAIFGCSDDGDNAGLPGHIRFEDVVLDKAKERKISRIHIDRFTGGVFRGGLFQEEALQSPIKLNITVTDGNDEACGMLLYALRDLGLGLFNLGSGGSVGRGYIRIDKVVADAPEGKRFEMEFNNRCGTVKCGEDVMSRWLKAVGGDGQ